MPRAVLQWSMHAHTIARTVRRELRGLVKYHKDYFGKDYCGACAISAWVLYKTLQRFGYKPTFVIGTFDSGNKLKRNEHAFVLLNGKVIDITATQFGLKPVVIEDLKGSKWDIWATGRSAKEVLRAWPREQDPFWWRHKLQKICDRCVEKLNKTAI